MILILKFNSIQQNNKNLKKNCNMNGKRSRS